MVKEFRYNHLIQEIDIRDQVPIQSSLPEVVDFLTNEERLHTMYKVDPLDTSLIVGGLGYMRGIMKAPNTVAKFCSMCTASVRTSGWFHVNRTVNCPSMSEVPDNHPTEEPRGSSCDACWILRRPCVWVPLIDLERPYGSFRFIRVPIADVIGP